MRVRVGVPDEAEIGSVFEPRETSFPGTKVFGGRWQDSGPVIADESAYT